MAELIFWGTWFIAMWVIGLFLAAIAFHYSIFGGIAVGIVDTLLIGSAVWQAITD